MFCTRIFSKAYALLLVSSLTTFALESPPGGDPTDEGTPGGGLKIINATQRDYDELFNALYTDIPPTENLTLEKESAIAEKFTEFFTLYPNEEKEISAIKYVQWTLSTNIFNKDLETPAWKELFFQFIVKDKSITDKNMSGNLSETINKLSEPNAYIPPHKRKRNAKSKDQLPLTTPRDIPFNFVIPEARNLKEYVTRDVIGQDEAVTSIITDICDNFVALRRNQYIHEYPDEARAKGWVTIPKKNMLIIGESGSGKTKTFEVIDQYFKENNSGIKIIKLNTSGLVSSGYRGGYNPTEIGEIILNAALDLSKKDIKNLTATDIENAQKRIIVLLDEFCKIRITGNDDSGVTNSKVQNELLPYFDEYGKILEVEKEIEPHVKRTFIVNTKNVLFIAMGAFAGLTSARHGGSHIITTEEIRMYGFLPEIIGRLPIITTYQPHTTNSLKRILKESRNSEIAQALTLLSDPFYNVTLNFSDKSCEAIAKKAIKSKTGARSLTPIVQGIVRHIKTNKEQYQGTTLTITEKMVEEHAPKDPAPFINPLYT